MKVNDVYLIEFRRNKHFTISMITSPIIRDEINKEIDESLAYLSSPFLFAQNDIKV